MSSRDGVNTSYRSKYPELYQFFAGYFYQGWASDYRWDLSEPTHKAVVRHFRAVNPPMVVEAVRNQLEQLMSSDGDDNDRLTQALFELGSGFNPGSEGLNASEWLRQITEVLSESAATAVVLRERH